MHFRKLFFVWAGGGLEKPRLQNYFIANFDMSNIVLP